MNVELKYLGRSGVSDSGAGSALSFAPNLARPKVFFDQQLRDPIRFREAISALHEVVVGDLRFKKKDKSAYEQWKANEAREEQQIRALIYDQAKKAELAKITNEPLPENLEADFRRMHSLYWTARRQWARELQQSDPELFRHLVPCDPVVTVAPDVVFFECFAKDESSYGCLFVDRESFSGKGEAGEGTTNVDYSLTLYEHFQTLRTYRATRLCVDPTGFEVKVEGNENYREEKIDLPPSWLRGFGQLQASMGLPTRKVELSVDAAYSLLAWLKRHREKTGPRSLKFQLTPGRPASVLVEPWSTVIHSRGRAYEGERPEEIKVWGRRRLMVLARVLPLADRVEVQLLGSGMPSIWTVYMGDMRLVLALSGWTSNDWTSGASLELLAGAYRPDARALVMLEKHLSANKRATLAQLSQAAEAPRDSVLGSLHLLAKQGQVIYDFAAQAYRWRQVMPVALSESVIGPESPEVVAGRELVARNGLKITSREPLTQGRTLYVARWSAAQSSVAEAIFDLDGKYSKAKCGCSFFYSSGLRKGPCRHLYALKLLTSAPTDSAPTPKDWIH